LLNNRLFWQDKIDLINGQNPAGEVTDSDEYARFLGLFIAVGFLVAIKRCWVGLSFGKRTYCKITVARFTMRRSLWGQVLPPSLTQLLLHFSALTVRYGDDLARLMKKALLIGKVAELARDIDVSKTQLPHGIFVDSSEVGDDTGSVNNDHDDATMDRLEGLDPASRHMKIQRLLGEWEEPKDRQTDDSASIAAVVQFRQSLSYLSASVPFSAAFGSATSRQDCLASAERVYDELLSGTPDASVLSFNVIALLTLDRKGNIDEEEAREYVKLFRPDREGNLSLLDFVKSIDVVYKELRLLRASVLNSSKVCVFLHV